ncbi:MAG: hypothetical protein Q8Q63_08580, partial [Phaeovulum sp.]|uniref:hypothetical protein n=1 Tax=Phaeovulum sp. TaxID=2934796 RepID=UPI002734893B
MKRAALILTMLLAGAGAVSAQVGSSSFYSNGSLQYEYLGNTSGASQTFATADFNVGMGFGGISSAPMGFELGVFSFAGDSGERYVLFPTLWMDSAYGRFSVGAPRSALGSALSFPNIGGSSILSLELRSIANLTDFVVLDESDVRSFGARFDGAVGSLDAGLSVHGFTGSGEGDYSVTGVVGR